MTSQSFCEEVAARPWRRRRASGSWPTMIVSARPTMKPLSTGSEMKLARKPSRSTPPSERHQPGADRQRRGHCREPAAPLGCVRGHDRGRQCRGGRHRARHQVARAAERGVEDQRPGRRVQPDDRRHAGDRRVGQRLRDQHRPDREPREQVAAQPLPAIAAKRREQPAHRISGVPSRAPLFGRVEIGRILAATMEGSPARDRSGLRPGAASAPGAPPARDRSRRACGRCSSCGS